MQSGARDDEDEDGRQNVQRETKRREEDETMRKERRGRVATAATGDGGKK